MKKTSILFGIALGVSLNAHAAVQYTDFATDSIATTSSNSSFDIDVDGDQQRDFTFTISGVNSSMYGISLSTSYGEMVVDNLAYVPNSSFASILFSGIEINSNNKWADYTRNVRVSDQSKSNLLGEGEQFLGFRLKDGNDYYYGWILVELTANLEFHVKAFAIEDSPNTPITIGDNGSAIMSLGEQDETEINVYPTVVKDEVNISSLSAIGEVKIFNLTGSLVYSTTSAKKELGLSLANYASGVYIISFKDEKGRVYSQKITKRN